MEDGPSFLDLVRANHEFPGEYIFKVIGNADETFVARVMVAVREELNLEIDPPFTMRQSSKGKFVALTIVPFLMQAEEVLAVYTRFKQIKGIVTYC